MNYTAEPVFPNPTSLLYPPGRAVFHHTHIVIRRSSSPFNNSRGIHYQRSLSNTGTDEQLADIILPCIYRDLTSCPTLLHRPCLTVTLCQALEPGWSDSCSEFILEFAKCKSHHKIFPKKAVQWVLRQETKTLGPWEFLFFDRSVNIIKEKREQNIPSPELEKEM